MKIKISAKGFKASHALNDYISSKLYLMLSRYSGRINRVEVTLSSVNGAEDDMKCLIKLKLSRFKSIVVHDIATDMYDAISGSTQRAKRAVERHMNRIRKLHHSSKYRFA